MEQWWNDIFAGETEVLGENLPSATHFLSCLYCIQSTSYHTQGLLERGNQGFPTLRKHADDRSKTQEIPSGIILKSNK
jgi:hypothetical protein